MTKELLEKALSTLRAVEQQPDYELVAFNVMDKVEQTIFELDIYLKSLDNSKEQIKEIIAIRERSEQGCDACSSESD